MNDKVLNTPLYKVFKEAFFRPFLSFLFILLNLGGCHPVQSNSSKVKFKSGEDVWQEVEIFVILVACLVIMV